MKCQYCQKRKAFSVHLDEGLGANVQLCRKCARAFYPTPEQEKEDYEIAEMEDECVADMQANEYHGRQL